MQEFSLKSHLLWRKLSVVFSNKPQSAAHPSAQDKTDTTQWLPSSDKFNSAKNQMEYDLPSSIFITLSPPCDHPECQSVSSASSADYDRGRAAA